jgi:hypothetical protein
MNITSIKVENVGRDSNERITCDVTLSAGESPDDALRLARQFVGRHTTATDFYGSKQDLDEVEAAARELAAKVTNLRVPF